ncbi:MAG: SRPBCC family protein [Pyrinomonadaceae bacterium]
MARLLERRFKVKVPLDRAWAHLEKVEQWPSWARHIRRIDLRPTGSLGPNSEGVIQLTNGMRSTFRMEELNVGTNWKWAGRFLWITVHYDHQFSRIGTEESEIGFVLDGEGFAVKVFGWLFAAIYARNLDRAIPKLVKELENH